MLALAIAGLIEGFVTGRVSSTVLRVGIGAVAFSAFWAYIVVLGRNALARGGTGSLGERERAGAPAIG